MDSCEDEREKRKRENGAQVYGDRERRERSEGRGKRKALWCRLDLQVARYSQTCPSLLKAEENKEKLRRAHGCF